jgi:VWFA-related protein
MVRFRIPALVCNASPRLILICVLTLAFAAVAHAQTPDDVITTSTALVQLNVGVVDQRGRVVTNLSKSDFAVFEDGLQRPIVNFEPTDAPFSLVMMLDTSGSTINFRQQINQAALRFLDALSPEDRVAVVDFNGKGVKLDQPFTTDRG